MFRTLTTVFNLKHLKRMLTEEFLNKLILDSLYIDYAMVGTLSTKEFLTFIAILETSYDIRTNYHTRCEIWDHVIILHRIHMRTESIYGIIKQ